jgi:hypothetical protein
VHCVCLVYGGLGVYGTRRVIFAHVVIHQLLLSSVIQRTSFSAQFPHMKDHLKLGRFIYKMGSLAKGSNSG